MPHWGVLKRLPQSWTHNVPTYLHNFLDKSHQNKHEGRSRRYYQCEIIKSTSYTWRQNAQSNLKIYQERKITHSKIKPHPKSVWQNFENPLAHPKCVNHLRPKCNPKEFLCLKISNGFQSLHFDILTLSPTRANWVERWSKARIIPLIGPKMWVSSIRYGKT
jgi:hypothetical protein